MTAKIIPFPTQSPFDLQQRAIDVSLSVLRQRFPFETDETLRRAASEIALRITFGASIDMTPELGPAPFLTSPI